MRIAIGTFIQNQQSLVALRFSVTSRATDGTTATLRITGTLRASAVSRSSDGTTATLRIN